MEKYWEGGVAALLSKGKASNVTNNKSENVNSEKLSKKDNSNSVHIMLKNELVKTSSIINNKKSLKSVRKKKKKPSDDEDCEPSTDMEIMSSKKRKCISSKTQSLENVTTNILPNEMKKQKNVRKINVLQRKEPPVSQKSNNTGDLSSVRDTSFQGNQYKPHKIKNKNANTNTDVDKSSYTIFVGNLPLSYDHKKVVKLFSKFGKVESARIRCVPVPTAKIKKKTSAITKKFHPNRNSAVAFVVFESQDSVTKAIAENGMILNGHHLRIDTCVHQKRDSNKSVFVGGLPFDIEDDELWDFFKVCGEIESVRIIRDDKVSMGKGFGYVNFKSSASVELALKLNGQEVKNRKINVERCVDKKRKTNLKKSFDYDKKKKHEKWQTTLCRKKSKQKSSAIDFQGRKSEKKQRKRKNSLTKDAIRKKQIKSVLLSASGKI